MQIKAHCQTDVGLKRDSNQDSFLIDDDVGLYIVADGMGGHKGGEVASSMAVEITQSYFHEHGNSEDQHPRDQIFKAYKMASQKIYDKSNFDTPELSGMGTTMVAVVARDDKLYIANVGDSRAYLFVENQLWQVTEDHSLLNEQIRAGLLTEEQSKYFAGKNVITRSVGFERDVECDILERPMIVGEKYLVCSGGLSGLVSDQRICQLMKTFQDDELVGKCIEEAKLNGGDDNVTVMVLEVVN